VSLGWLQANGLAFGLMLIVCWMTLLVVPAYMPAVAIEATRRLATLLAEEGGVQFATAFPATGEAESSHESLFPRRRIRKGMPKQAWRDLNSLCFQKGKSRATSPCGRHCCFQRDCMVLSKSKKLKDLTANWGRARDSPPRSQLFYLITR
jgi:hypothetical protein